MIGLFAGLARSWPLLRSSPTKLGRIKKRTHKTCFRILLVSTLQSGILTLHIYMPPVPRRKASSASHKNGLNLCMQCIGICIMVPTTRPTQGKLLRPEKRFPLSLTHSLTHSQRLKKAACSVVPLPVSLFLSPLADSDTLSKALGFLFLAQIQN